MLPAFFFQLRQQEEVRNATMIHGQALVALARKLEARKSNPSRLGRFGQLGCHRLFFCLLKGSVFWGRVFFIFSPKGSCRPPWDFQLNLTRVHSD